MGAEGAPASVRAVLSEPVKRRKSDRIAHIPVSFDEGGGVKAIEYHGSAHILAFAHADGFIAVPAGASVIDAGETVEVMPTK